MQLNSARQAWHDSLYMPWDSVMAGSIDRAQLGIIEASGYVRRKATEIDESGKEISYTRLVLAPGIKGTRPDGATSTGRCAHQAIAGRVQMAIDTLSSELKAFGHWLYSPTPTAEHRESAEETVFCIAYHSLVQAGGRMTTAKWQKAEFVAKGVLYRYRRMHQGGQSSCEDPLAKPEAFRAALLDTYGVALASENWAREWGPFVQTCFDVCNDIDKQALRPVAAVISEMKEAA
ncbi:hypothetical protein D3879_14740 [Pseudomonas cavernicola]|uniref:Uncharacterized protein n=1 Tax=Pseudomonas cavernicola TaxID=2320866 RepID=A0A418XEH3_9PSED|nr:hypothetical protein [Pseudomonas cavernicola]RJG10934.1 hypothetical protein D3879_14740 [Pseudomonas cavernicola]